MEAQTIQIPTVYRDSLIGYRDSLKIWLFSNQLFEPSYWLILKREGFSGLAYAPVEELDIFVLSLSSQQLTDIYQLHFRSQPTELNFLELRLSVHHLLQTNIIRVYYLEDPDGTHETRLADAGDAYYAMPVAFEPQSAGFYRNQLAESLGQHIASRWLGKEKADGIHFSRPWIVRQIIEDSDVGQAVVDTGWDFIKGLWDIGCLVFTIVGEVLVLQLKINQQILKSIADLSTGDLQAIEKDLQSLGLFAHQKLKSAQQLKETIENGFEILQLLIDDPHTHQLFYDYLDSLYESMDYRRSRTVIVRVLAEIGLEVLIALATMGIGNAARRAGQLVHNADHAVDLARGTQAIGPFTRESIEKMADLAHSLRAERIVTPDVKSPAKLDVPDYAKPSSQNNRQKRGDIDGPENETHPKTAPRMKQHDVDCFKAGDRIPANKYPEYDRQLADQQNGLNDMTVQEYLDGRENYKNFGRGDGATQQQARSDYAQKRNREIVEELMDEDIFGDAARDLADQRVKAEMSTLDALHNPDMIVGGKDAVSELGDRSVNRSIGSQWGKPKGVSRVEKLDSVAEDALKAQGPDAHMNVNMHRCK